jgi:hypothetical protein
MNLPEHLRAMLADPKTLYRNTAINLLPLGSAKRLELELAEAREEIAKLKGHVAALDRLLDQLLDEDTTSLQ